MNTRKCIKCGRLKALNRENYYYKRKAEDTYRDVCIECHHGGPNMDWAQPVEGPRIINNRPYPDAKERDKRTMLRKRLLKLIRQNYNLWKHDCSPVHHKKMKEIDDCAIYEHIGRKPRLQMVIDFVEKYDIEDEWDRLVDPKNFHWKK
jgi:hypothetical protein